MKNIYFFSLILSLFLIQGKSFAAPDAGSLLKDQQDLQKLNELPKSIPENLFENSIENNSSSTEEDKILVKEFVFDGDIKAFTNDELKKVIADLYNKELTFNEIQSAAVRTAAVPVSRCDVQPQSLRLPASRRYRHPLLLFWKFCLPYPD